MNERTGRKRAWSRQMGTRRSVLLADVVSHAVITAGGVGTILAVLGVCLFLVWVACPLFQAAVVSGSRTHAAEWPARDPLGFGIDEYQVLGWTILADGTARAFRVDTGEVIHEQRLFTNRVITAASTARGASEEAVFGFSDGSIQRAQIGFRTVFLPPEKVPAQVHAALVGAEPGASAMLDDGVVQLTPEGQYRLQRLFLEQRETAQVADSPIRVIEHIPRTDGHLYCFLAGDDTEPKLAAVLGREKQSFLSGESTFVFDTPMMLPFRAAGAGVPSYLALSAQGADLYVGWREGTTMRIRCSDLNHAFIAETGRLYDDQAELAFMRFMLGDNTLVWGDSKGRVGAGFTVRRSELVEEYGLVGAERVDEAAFAFARAKEMGQGGASLSAFGSSSRSRIIACGYTDGLIRLFNPTSEGLVASLRVPSGEAIRGVVLSPKEDGLLAYTAHALFHCDVDVRHPEANFSALFRPVWYEGYARPQHMWQSSSATDDFEPKLGLFPLIFGTLKATVYSMIFGAPIALLAAIFSSEYLHPRIRTVVKPTIELMASLPSVVLGFLAALVLAPVVEKVVPSTLAAFYVIPFCLLMGAYLWQAAPPRITLPLEHLRVGIILVPIVLGCALAVWIGPVIERIFFAGDLKAWLAWDPGRAPGADAKLSDAVGGWMLLFLPLSVFATVFFFNRLLNNPMRVLARRLGRQPLAWACFGKFILYTALALALAWGVSSAVSGMGFDPRGLYLDTYVQRNALVVGIVMGFAIIPIIYTISDDALSTVPDHLRGASYAAGATKWQTAVRVVIPTAMSGLFSALMIGLGRAVGETMIVLMAAGNTPVMSWNIFEGFRTLSANIAVELPEAVKDSTHYRTLFLAALVLFAMTFVVNTIAELVRLRFRKRAVAL